MITPVEANDKQAIRYGDLVLAGAVADYLEITSVKDVQLEARAFGLILTEEQATGILQDLLEFADGMTELARLPDAERFAECECDGDTA